MLSPYLNVFTSKTTIRIPEDEFIGDLYCTHCHKPLLVEGGQCEECGSEIAKLVVSGETRGEALLRMRRALEEFKIIGIRTNIPFHQRIMDSARFMAGQYDTRFVEERFSMEAAEEIVEDLSEVAAIMATLVAHQQTQRAAHIIQRNERDTSNWKWVGRWERMQR